SDHRCPLRWSVVRRSERRRIGATWILAATPGHGACSIRSPEPMSRPCAILVVSLVLGLVAHPSAGATCSTDDRLKLFEDGWDKTGADKFCGGGDTDSRSRPSRRGSDDDDLDAPRTPRPRVGGDSPSQNQPTICVTNGGTCALTVRGIKGAVCLCYTPF